MLNDHRIVKSALALLENYSSTFTGPNMTDIRLQLMRMQKSWCTRSNGNSKRRTISGYLAQRR